MSIRIRVATYNVHKCRGLDRRTSPERIASVISELEADVVAIQEVLNVVGGRAQDDQARRQILVSYRTGDMYAPKLDRTEALAGVVSEFADAIAAKRKPLTDAVAGIHVVSLLEAAEQSLRSEGRRVRL